jgi:transposase
VTITTANLPDDVDVLKRIIAEMVQEAVASQVEIEKLRFELARLKRA